MRQTRFRAKLRAILDHRSNNAFIARLPKGARVLDVGCGNHSPTRFIALNPYLQYIGIDIAEYNLDANDHKAAEELYFCEPKYFARRIKEFGPTFDAVVSSHNLEHTDAPMDVVDAMCSCLNRDGTLYLSFPAETSILFPKRKGCLNFYDDPTHRYLPNFEHVCSAIERSGCSVMLRVRRHRPIALFLLGAVLEPWSILLNRSLPGTWAFWGFETILIAQRR